MSAHRCGDSHSVASVGSGLVPAGPPAGAPGREVRGAPGSRRVGKAPLFALAPARARAASPVAPAAVFADSSPSCLGDSTLAPGQR